MAKEKSIEDQINHSYDNCSGLIERLKHNKSISKRFYIKHDYLSPTYFYHVISLYSKKSFFWKEEKQLVIICRNNRIDAYTNNRAVIHALHPQNPLPFSMNLPTISYKIVKLAGMINFVPNFHLFGIKPKKWIDAEEYMDIIDKYERRKIYFKFVDNFKY